MVEDNEEFGVDKLIAENGEELNVSKRIVMSGENLIVVGSRDDYLYGINSTGNILF